MMIKVGVMGATGYTGAELVRLIDAHPAAQIEMLTSTSQAGKRYGEVFGRFGHTGYVLEADDWGAAADRCDVVFLALPHGVATRHVAQGILDKTAVIDLGADFRLRDAAVYEEWYGAEHHAKQLLPQAVYGLTELYRRDIQNARLIANPGCYTTCSILALYPLLKAGLIERDGVIIDALSGVSGAGRTPALGGMFCEADESVKAYKVTGHRHTPEIEQELGCAVTFTPHLIPMERGILATCYAVPKPGVTVAAVREAYRELYGGERFIRLLTNESPETRHVAHTNYVDIAITYDERTNRLKILSALDNLMKGASGQAVQNMNLLFNLPEETGLI